MKTTDCSCYQIFECDGQVAKEVGHIIRKHPKFPSVLSALRAPEDISICWPSPHSRDHRPELQLNSHNFLWYHVL